MGSHRLSRKNRSLCRIVYQRHISDESAAVFRADDVVSKLARLRVSIEAVSDPIISITNNLRIQAQLSAILHAIKNTSPAQCTYEFGIEMPLEISFNVGNRNGDRPAFCFFAIEMISPTAGQN